MAENASAKGRESAASAKNPQKRIFNSIDSGIGFGVGVALVFYYFGNICVSSTVGFLSTEMIGNKNYEKILFLGFKIGRKMWRP